MDQALSQELSHKYLTYLMTVLFYMGGNAVLAC